MAIGYIARYGHLQRHFQPILNELWNRGLEVHEGTADLTLCAARYDVEKVRGSCVLVEHGAGQTYQVKGETVDAGWSPQTYPQVKLYIGPNQKTCELMARWLPNAEMLVASPVIEWMRSQPRDPWAVTFAVHWASPLASIVPEAGTSWPASAWIVKALRPDFIHAHPRIQYRIRRDIKQRKLPGTFVEDWDQVWPQTRLLVVDNSSILWEAAAVGIEVALVDGLNWGGRHGLRFGVEADLLQRVTVIDAPMLREALLPKPAGSPYELIDGATVKAADAICSIC